MNQAGCPTIPFADFPDLSPPNVSAPRTELQAFPRLRKTPPLHLASLLVLAVLFTLANCLKPLHMDDTAYRYYAAQIAEHPLDPYGFQVFWYQHPQPASEVLAPPLLLYWWALAIRLFGEQPWLWKLWLLPFSLFLVAGLYRLCRRFARGLEIPLVWMTVLSPTLLPSFNLMLDVPALALSLFALTTFLGACERHSPALAVLAGLVAGLAMETKYTALLTPPVMFLYGAGCRRFRLTLLAGVSAFLVPVAWELFMARLYGESHFLHHLGGHGEALLKNRGLLVSLGMILGAVAPALALVGLLALNVRRWVVAMIVGFVLLGFFVLICSSSPFVRHFRLPERPFVALELSTLRLSRESLFFGTIGWLLCGMLAAISWQLYRRTRGKRPNEVLSSPLAIVHPITSSPRQRANYFLALWLALEIAGYFALSPFPAVRRVMGIVVVATILIGRLAARTCRSRGRALPVRAVMVGGMALGLVYYAVDLREALTQQQAAELAGAFTRQQRGGAVWYVGHWGFQYYAERAGMKPVVPGQSRLDKGDWLVIPDPSVNQQQIMVPENTVERAYRFRLGDVLPLRTMGGYYGSRLPLEPTEGPRVTVTVYRVTAPFLFPPAQLLMPP